MDRNSTSNDEPTSEDEGLDTSNADADADAGRGDEDEDEDDSSDRAVIERFFGRKYAEFMSGEN